MRDLKGTLRALYDSEINVTITTLWDGGWDCALVSYMSDDYREHTGDWTTVLNLDELADALHDMAIEQFPNSKYAQDYRAWLREANFTAAEIKQSQIDAGAIPDNETD